MKSLKILALSVSMAFVGAITFNSCSDPCKDVTCQNGGSCNEGDCDCATGYEGESCETEQRAKFAGTYSVNESCNSGNFSYSVGVTNGSASVSNIIISNFGDYDVNVTATVNEDGSGITIASQQVSGGGFTFTFSGSGQISGNILTINYTVTSGGVSDTCTMTCTKQ